MNRTSHSARHLVAVLALAIALGSLGTRAAIARVSSPDVTRLADGRTLVVERPDGTPRGVMLLIPGGSTQLSLDAAGRTTSENFVIRTRAAWRDAGFATAYLDDPTDLREPIARLRTLGVPIVVLATSRGTIVAAQNAARLGAGGADLLILTSPVTSGAPGRRSAHPGVADSLAAVDVRPIAVPTLIVTNDDDACRVSTPADAQALVARFAPATDIIHVASSAVSSGPCDALAPHGYLGIESTVIDKIRSWVSAHLAPSPKP